MFRYQGFTSHNYDLGSIMHYRPDAFSTNNLPTIVPRHSAGNIGLFSVPEYYQSTTRVYTQWRGKGRGRGGQTVSILLIPSLILVLLSLWPVELCDKIKFSDRRDWVLMGQRRALSQTDKDKLNTLYECHQVEADTQPRCGVTGSASHPLTTVRRLSLIIIYSICQQIN